MINSKVIIVFGGTGFIGRSVVEKYCKNNWKIVIPTRIKDIDSVKKKMILHGFNQKLLEEKISEEMIVFLFDINITDTKWNVAQNWHSLFESVQINISSIKRVFNFVGETSGNKEEIVLSIINSLVNVFTLVKILKDKNDDVIFVNLGSTVEKSKSKYASPYEYAKKTSRELVDKNQLCDFHFIVEYVKGSGEQKMTKAAPVLWNKLRYSTRWLFGFEVSVIDVDNFSDIIFHLIETIKYVSKNKPVEINVTNGEIVFGEMIKNLLPEDQRMMPERVLPKFCEKIFLMFYLNFAPILKPNNHLIHRLAKFAEKSLIPKEKQKSNMKTVSEIKKLLTHKDYKVIEEIPYLIVAHQKGHLVYILSEKDSKEIKKIIQKSIKE
jgi:hypothetical protein